MPRSRTSGPPLRAGLPFGLALALAGLGPIQGRAEVLRGSVVDPQERVVVGASVSLLCGAVAEGGRSDGRGEFRFDRGQGFLGCTVSAHASGFVPSPAHPVGAAPLVVRLGLPPHAETLTVRPRDGEAGLTPFRSLASASLSGPELRLVSGESGEILRYARARAGLASPTAGHLYVDGLPAGTPPPADAIDRILVDADPFSAENGDGSDGHVDVLTLVPERRLRLSLGGAALGAGGRSVLDPRAESASSAWRVGLTGPVPRVPLVFSVHATAADDRQEVPLRALVPASAASASPSAAVSSASSRSVRLALDLARGESTRASVCFLAAHGSRSGVGVSGTTLPEAGMSLRSELGELRASFTTRRAGRVHRAGLVGSRSESAFRAESRRPGVGVSGLWTGGGAETAAADVRGDRWSLKYVVRAEEARRPWTAGAVVSWSADAESSTLNPAGRVQFESAQAYADAASGLGTGTWLGARGTSGARYAGATVSPFVEAELLPSSHLRLRGGLRADYQAGGGTLFSPRLSFAATWGRTTLRGGGGVFVHDWATSVLLQALRNDRSHLDRFVLTGVSLAAPEMGDASRAVPIDSRLASDFTRPRDLVLRVSAERPLGPLTPGIEYTRTSTTHLLGSRRTAFGEGWMDTLESNRFARRHQLHLRLQGEVKGQRLSAHYQWTRSRDDTSGPFSFPESIDALLAEAARSAGVPRHEVSVVGSFRLPAGIALTVLESYRGSSPYDVTTGRDPSGRGLYNDRGGRARNGGDGLASHSTTLYCSRRVALPFPGGRSGRKTYANVSVQVENLLNQRNVLVVGNVAGSPLLGVPLSAGPGRSVRATVSLDP